MLKIPKKASVLISLVLTVIFMLVLIFLAVVMPVLSEMLINAQDSIGNRNDITDGGRIAVLILAYCLLVTAAVADFLLFLLLIRVLKGLVFTERSIAYIRGVSWCAILVGIIFALLGIWFQISFIVGFAALFLALCLRVVKNVIEEATDIKSENDLTI